MVTAANVSVNTCDATPLGVQSVLYARAFSVSDVLTFTLPPFADGTRWLCLIDTNDPDRGDLRYFKTGEEYAITGRSVLLFAGLIAGEGARAVRRIALELSRGDAVTS